MSGAIAFIWIPFTIYQISFNTQISKENLFKKALCERAAANAT